MDFQENKELFENFEEKNNNDENINTKGFDSANPLPQNNINKKPGKKKSCLGTLVKAGVSVAFIIAVCFAVFYHRCKVDFSTMSANHSVILQFIQHF